MNEDRPQGQVPRLLSVTCAGAVGAGLAGIFAGIVFGIEAGYASREGGLWAVGSGLSFMAAAVAFGLLANALLRQ